jgi:hypothetical protein
LDVSTPIRPGVLLEGAVFPEPLRVVRVEQTGTHLRVGGQGCRTGHYHECLLTPRTGAGPAGDSRRGPL